tara:strand:+ start:19368 stop:19556 length:189 start_codon:yes stop_codon:yes gene_type:complete
MLKKALNTPKKRGQALVEYIVLVGLISMLTLGLIVTFSGEIGDTIEDAIDSTAELQRQMDKA